MPNTEALRTRFTKTMLILSIKNQYDNETASRRAGILKFPHGGSFSFFGDFFRLLHVFIALLRRRVRR